MPRPARPQHHTFTGASEDRGYPAGYPSGWYRLIDLDELRPGDLRAIDCLGKHLVVFRGRDSGAYSVVDAHCPHQGASLAGGEVCGDHVVCPFHRWRFAPDGRLAAIPNLERLPRVGVRAYPVREHCGMLWMYHDISGLPVDPPYEPEPLDDIADGRLVYRGRHAVDDVHMHLSEFAENSVDFQHFHALHGDMTLPWTRVRLPGFGIQHRARWAVDLDAPHKAVFTNDACLTFRGTAYPRSGAHAKVTLFGPAGVVWFRFTLPELGDVVLFETHLPTDPLRQQVRFRWYADPKIPRGLVWWVVGHWVSQWMADVEVWENKVHRPRPVLVPLDGPVLQMRRWYAQFYASAAQAVPLAAG